MLSDSLLQSKDVRCFCLEGLKRDSVSQEQKVQGGRKSRNLLPARQCPTPEKCLAQPLPPNIYHDKNQPILSSFNHKTQHTNEPPSAIPNLQMPKAKKPTPKRRQAPYITPRQPTTNPRAPPFIPLIPYARNFAPPRGYTRTVPNPAYPQITLTTGELNQSFLDFIRDQQNGTTGSPDVVEGGTPGVDSVPDNEGDSQIASDDPEVGGSWGGGTGTVEEVVGENGIDQVRNGSTPDSRVNKGKKPVKSPNIKGINSWPSAWTVEDLSPLPGYGLPRQSPSPQQKSLRSYDSAPPKPLTEDEIWLERLRPVQEFHDNTPWPTSLYEQPLPTPAWHAECPKGYEPTSLAGYPVRRQYPVYIPAAHDPEMVLDEYGHYCVDLRESSEWDQCCMGKCEGCEICRPGR